MCVATQYAFAPCKLTIYSYFFARWHLFRHVGYLKHRQQVDLSPFDLESSVSVTCDVCYLCANFSLPRPLCSRLRPDERDRQTDVRQHHRLMHPHMGAGHNKQTQKIQLCINCARTLDRTQGHVT